MFLELLSKLVIYGLTGVIFEVVFTGLHSIIILRDKNAISRTSLWMVPIYGFGALLLGAERYALGSPLLFVPIATLSIFIMEYLSGWVFKKLGIKIWDYSHAKFSIHGLIRVDYLPFWVLVAVAYDILSGYVTKLFELIGRIS